MSSMPLVCRLCSFYYGKAAYLTKDIAALKQYYDSTYMVITHNDGCKSARIPLRRGVRQGSPLSPILGCIVINMLIRWIEDAGGGMSHLSGVITGIMAYCDDTTLTTEDLVCRDYSSGQYCQWVGVSTNRWLSDMSLAYPNSKAIISKGETGLLHQCTALDDDLAPMVRWDMQHAVLRWGCNSLEEASKESSLQRKRWTSTGSLCTRWLSHISSRWRVEWDH